MFRSRISRGRSRQVCARARRYVGRRCRSKWIRLRTEQARGAPCQDGRPIPAHGDGVSIRLPEPVHHKIDTRTECKLFPRFKNLGHPPQSPLEARSTLGIVACGQCRSARPTPRSSHRRGRARCDGVQPSGCNDAAEEPGLGGWIGFAVLYASTTPVTINLTGRIRNARRLATRQFGQAESEQGPLDGEST